MDIDELVRSIERDIEAKAANAARAATTQQAVVYELGMWIAEEYDRRAVSALGLAKTTMQIMRATFCDAASPIFVNRATGAKSALTERQFEDMFSVSGAHETSLDMAKTLSKRVIDHEQRDVKKRDEDAMGITRGGRAHP